MGPLPDLWRRAFGQRDDPFHTYEIELEVVDLAHLTRLLSALRASDAVAEAERV